MNRCRLLAMMLVLVVAACADRPEPTGPTSGALSNIAVTPTERDCFIQAGSFDSRVTTTTGESFFLEGAHDGDVEDADWAHDAVGFSFDSFDRAIEVTCLVNDSFQAMVHGYAVRHTAAGPELGYLYVVSVTDEGEPPEVVLEASNGQATASFPTPRTVVVPAELAVTSGMAGPGLVWISFDGTKCFYTADASGDAYVFSRCEDPGWAPGTFLAVTELAMEVAGPNRNTIVVSASVAGGAGSGPADQYTVNVWNEVTGELVYSYSGNVADGDIVITLLNP